MNGQIAKLADLQDCIGKGTNPQGVPYGTTCQLAQGTYTLPFVGNDNKVWTTLGIWRSGITITGQMVAGPADVVIRRGNSIVSEMMNDTYGYNRPANLPPPTNVTISYLTFDGNRYNAGAPCVDYSVQNAPSYFDVSLNSSGVYNLQWLDFINSPGTALILGNGSTIITSNFGQGGYGYGPNLALGSEYASQTAARRDAVAFTGVGGGAWYNAVAFAGTAGIAIYGTAQYAYGNLLSLNRYERSDGSQGGALFVDPGAVNARVAGNVINGDYWPQVIDPTLCPYTGYGTAAHPLCTGCPSVSAGQNNAGIEAYGFGHGFYNNEIEQNTGSGIQLGGSNPTGQITISSANPWDSTDTPRYIESNVSGGVVALGVVDNSHWTNILQGITLDDVLIRNNAGDGVKLDGVTPSQGYTGFMNGSCISGDTAKDTPVINNFTNPYNLPFNPAPSSLSNYRGGACPQPGWAAQWPSPSLISHWKW